MINQHILGKCPLTDEEVSPAPERQQDCLELLRDIRFRSDQSAHDTAGARQKIEAQGGYHTHIDTPPPR